MNWKWTTVFSILLLLLIFTLQNHTTVEVRFLFWSLKTSRAIVIFSSICAGFILGLIVSFAVKGNADAD